MQLKPTSSTINWGNTGVTSAGRPLLPPTHFAPPNPLRSPHPQIKRQMTTGARSSASKTTRRDADVEAPFSIDHVRSHQDYNHNRSTHTHTHTHKRLPRIFFFYSRGPLLKNASCVQTVFVFVSGGLDGSLQLRLTPDTWAFACLRHCNS